MFNWICHCRECQRSTGGGGAVNAVFHISTVQFVRGEPKFHESTGTTGHKTYRGFCAECGSPVVAKQSAFPVCVVYAASLDDPSSHRPTMDIFTSSAQPWDYMNPELPKFPRGVG